MKFKMYAKDPHNKRESVTLTLLIMASIVCMIRLILSDLTIAGYLFPHFPGSDCALIVSAFGGLYWARKHTKRDSGDNNVNGNEDEGA